MQLAEFFFVLLRSKSLMVQVKVRRLKVNVLRTNKIFSRYTSQKSITPVRCGKALWMRSEIGPSYFASLGFILALPYLVTVFERFFFFNCSRENKWCRRRSWRDKNASKHSNRNTQRIPRESRNCNAARPTSGDGRRGYWTTGRCYRSWRIKKAERK